jgi:prepilin-type N-terminal cleavage/methylation domain-containing protein
MKNRSQSIASEAGFSLVEVMVTVGILSITIIALSEFYTQVSNGQKRLERKFEVIQSSELLNRALEDLGTCNSHLAFNNLGVARTIDVSGSINPDGTILGAEFPLDDVRLGPLGSEVFAEPGQLLNNSRTGVRVATTSFKNVRPLDVANGRYSGDIEIALDVYPLIKPIRVPRIFKVDTNTPATIVRCVVGGSSPSAGAGAIQYFMPMPIANVRGSCANTFFSGFAGPRPEVSNGQSINIPYPVDVPATATEIQLELVITLGPNSQGEIALQLPGMTSDFPGAYVMNSGTNYGGSANNITIPYHASREFNIITRRRPVGTSPEDCYIFKFMGYRE